MQIGSIFFKLLCLATGALVIASPASLPTTVECLVVRVVIDALNAFVSATPFCSSFLRISTTTRTVTATTSVPTTVRATVTTGAVTTTANTRVTVTTTVATTTSTCVLAPARKREATIVDRQASTTISLPSALATIASTQLSTACRCLSIPTPSTTVTSTRTVMPTVTSTVTSPGSTTTVTPTTTTTVTTTATTSGCPAPSQCNNQGIQWMEYYNGQGNNMDDTYSTFDPTLYKTQTSSISGVTNTIGGIRTAGGQQISVYGNPQTFNGDYFVLNHRGYLFAVVSGTYTIQVTGADDAVFLWYGPNAYSGWTRANANLIVTYGGGSPSIDVQLTQGDYLPIRIVYAQGQGLAAFEISVSVGGNVLLDSNTQNSPYIIQYSCDGTLAPQYPPFGSET
ncbi:GLEYA domain-containing protein [Hypoxylon crocopeplum]|nr:GLEYA domain-containing protein [Hypoxylon crocopeplum]